MKNAFIVISSFFAFIGTLPYMRDVYRKKSKPREVSWFIWGLLAAITGAASLSDKQYASAILSLWVVIVTWTVVALGLRYGDKSFKLLDGVTLAASFIGLLLWWIFNSPAIAIIASLTIDLVASIPTYVHSWTRPNEETTSAYFLGMLASIFTLLAAKEVSVTAIAVPVYFIFADGSLVTILTMRSRRSKFAKPG
ncbi:hypothetical protein BVY00_00395 [bacterium G20]|nr:hypothetical protein BVY00_00395 [bacterium G20]